MLVDSPLLWFGPSLDSFDVLDGCDGEGGWIGTVPFGCADVNVFGGSCVGDGVACGMFMCAYVLAGRF